MELSHFFIALLFPYVTYCMLLTTFAKPWETGGRESSPNLTSKDQIYVGT